MVMNHQWHHKVTLKLLSLYSCWREFGSRSKFQWQYIINKCGYRYRLSTLFMPEEDLNKLHFPRLQFKDQGHRLTGWPWHIVGRSSVNLWIVEIIQNWNVGNIHGYVATAAKIRFHFWFPRSPDVAFGGHIGWLLNLKSKFGWRIIINLANYVNYNYFCDYDGITNVTRWLWKFSEFSSSHTVGIAGDVINYHTRPIVSRGCGSCLWIALGRFTFW